jgi:hypothetical protein
VLSLIVLRFTALAICLADGVSLDEHVWLRTAGLVDRILEYDAETQEDFLTLIEQKIMTDLNNLTIPAMF